MNFKMDQKFKDYFQDNLRQIFFYLIDDCNLRCVQCLYKLEIGFQVEKKEVPYTDAVKLLEDFREMGAVKLTLMGGEPTLYGIRQNNRPLLDLIKKSKELGYEYVRHIDDYSCYVEDEEEAKKFIEDGCKVKITVRFRGRELNYAKQGEDILNRFIEELSEVATPEKKPILEGKNMFIILAKKAEK